MDRSHFYEANKTSLDFFYLCMIFGELCKISVFFVEKRKIKEKEKNACIGLVQPTAKLA
jgi:hypothetical protein